MNRFIIIVLLNLFATIIYGQEVKDSIPNLDLARIAKANQSDSYITFPIDIGNIEPLMFEANVNPAFTIRERKDSKLMAVLTPQIIIRMYNEDSYPVRTPSYIPQVSFYYLANKKESLNYTTFFGKIAHHSNGQEDEFYNYDGTINLQSGNFSDNYFELGMIKTSYSNTLKAVRFIKSSFEIHPQSWMSDELQGQYSGFRWHNTFAAFKLPFVNSDKEDRPNFSVKIETTLMLDDYNNLKTFDLDRFSVSALFYYHPKFLEEIGLFVQLYHGMDYYNIYFNHQIDIIRFGIMTETLKF
jgi:hypothetical protein